MNNNFEVGKLTNLKSNVDHDKTYETQKRINIVNVDKRYSIKVVDMNKLPKYGFNLYKNHLGQKYYKYKLQTGVPIYCDIDCVDRYITRNPNSNRVGHIKFDYPNPNISMELLYLLTAMLKDGVIIFEESRKADRNSEKIAKLEKQIAKLQAEKKQLEEGDMNV